MTDNYDWEVADPGLQIISMAGSLDAGSLDEDVVGALRIREMIARHPDRFLLV